MLLTTTSFFSKINVYFMTIFLLLIKYDYFIIQMKLKYITKQQL